MTTLPHNPIAQARPERSARDPRDTQDVSLLLLKAFLLGLLLIGTGFADRITLRSSVEVTGDTVTLADIARLEGEHAEALGEVTLATFADDSAQVRITRQQVRQLLDDRGVHWGRLSLRGHQSLRIERVAPDEPRHAPADEPIVEDAAVQANPVPTVDAADAGRTLRQIVHAYLLERGGVPAERMKIDWHQDASPVWQRTEADGRFEIDPQNRDTAGHIPLTVRQYRGDQLVDTLRLSADVRMQRNVVIATGRIARGQTLTADDLRSQMQWLDTGRDRPLTDAAALVGQVADRTLREGDVLSDGDVKPPLLVERGQTVTLRTISGGLVIKTTARALDDGGADQIITVRHPRTRQLYQARVSGPRQAVMLLDGEQDNQDQTGGDS